MLALTRLGGSNPPPSVRAGNDLQGALPALHGARLFQGTRIVCSAKCTPLKLFLAAQPVPEMVDLLVNAIDEEAAAFWRRRGFMASHDDPLVLFRSIADIAASIRAASF